jgi:diguanylate cyclase (GGDEF)-like protein/PAS domain S-box-containing protein
MKQLEVTSAINRLSAQLRIAQRIAEIGSWEANLADNSVIWSEETHRIFGTAPDNFIPTIDAVFSMVHPADREMLHLAQQETISKNLPVDIEHRIVRPDGEVRYVHERAELHLDEEGHLVLTGTVQDITKRKTAEENVSRLAWRLINTLESITDAFYTLDDAWRFTFLNREAERLLNRSRNELVGKILWEEFTEAIGTKIYQQYHLAHEERCPVRFEEYYPPFDKWFELRVFPSDDGLAVYFQDITERRLSQDAIRKSQERFDLVAKATSDTVWDWDIEADTVWRSEKFLDQHGFSSEEVAAYSIAWVDRIHPEDKTDVLSGTSYALKNGKDKWSAEYRFLQKDGSYAHVLDRGYISRDTQGKALRVVGCMTNITSQKQAALELKRLNRALLLRGECDRTINTARTEYELLASICQLAVSSGGYRLAWIGYAHDDERKSITIEAHAGTDEDVEFAKTVELSWSETNPLGHGPAGKTIRSGVALVMDDITSSSDLAPWLLRKDHGPRGLIALPFRNQSRTLGVMVLYARDLLTASSEEVKLLQELADNVSHGIEHIRSQEEKHRIQAAITKVAASVSANNGTEFFAQLAMNMAEALDADASFIARLLPEDASSAKTIVAVLDKSIIPNFEYKLAGTPCENLIENIAWHMPAHVAARFPLSTTLTQLGMQAYVGRRLDDASGRPIGLLFALFRKPLQISEVILNSMQIFASRAAAELERQNTDLRIREQAALLDKAKDAIVVKDTNGRVRFWNKGAERLYGWSSGEAIGQSAEGFLFENIAQFQGAIKTVLLQGQWSGEATEIRKDGIRLIVENHWTLVKGENGRPQSIFAIKTDITQRKAAEKEIHTLAFYDALTGLPNRRFILERINRTLSVHAKLNKNGALLFVDLDNFKTLNDSLGHDQGDELLRQVAERLRTAIRNNDVVARLGGDEFVIMLECLSNDKEEAMTQAKCVGEKVLSAFNLPFSIMESDFFCTPSIGISLFEDVESANELLRHADLAMYQAKAAGRNTLRLFDPEMQSRIATKLALESELRQAIQRNELSLHFQPQVDGEGNVIGAEALTRWENPARGFVSPANFIPIAEETGLIIALGEWVLHHACMELVTWARDPHLDSLTLAVNVSARQFRHPDFVATLLGIIEKTKVDPHKLKLEITESVLIDNVEEIIEKMTALRAHGISFSLDDFGTGYSSLMYLKRLPLSQLKIDPSFVRDILGGHNDAALVRTIIALGQSLNLSVIAEGVETQTQRKFLADIGCDLYQGYLFSRPVPGPAFRNLELLKAKIR